MKKIALITGATSGIGRATASALAPDYSLILCGRRMDRLQALQSELGQVTEVTTLAFDVSKRAEVDTAIASLPPQWVAIHVLVNNAGNAHGMSPIQEGDVQDWDAMMDINVKGLLYVSKAILPGMVSRGAGHVINIGSIAGIEVYPNGNVYSASKHAVDAISKGMRQDLFKHGIKVSEIKPGLVETEFSLVRFKGDAERSAGVYQGLEPLVAQDVADAIAYVLSRPLHVNIADMLILPSAQATATMVDRKQS